MSADTERIAGAERIKVCLITSGSPFRSLIEALPDVDFTVLAIGGHVIQHGTGRSGLLSAPLPANVVAADTVALPSASAELLRSSLWWRLPRNVERAWQDATDGYEALLHGDWEPFPRLYRALRLLEAQDIFASQRYRASLKRYHRMMAREEPFEVFASAWRAWHLRLYAVLQSEPPKADVYHALDSGLAGLLGVCGKEEHGGALVVTEDGSAVLDADRSFAQAVFHRLQGLAYGYADRVVFAGAQERQQQILSGLPPDRANVIPIGIETDKFAHLAPRIYDGMIRVGLIGPVTTTRDVTAFIASAKIVAETLPNTEFEIIGSLQEDPAYVASCRALVRELRLESCLAFVGAKDPADYLSRLDIAASTSWEEAHPSAILEAMAAGVPVVATRTDGLPEIVEGCGELVWPRDVQGIADAIIRLARDERLRRETGERAKQHIREHYDQKQCAEKVRHLYGFLSRKQPEQVLS